MIKRGMVIAFVSVRGEGEKESHVTTTQERDKEGKGRKMIREEGDAHLLSC